MLAYLGDCFHAFQHLRSGVVHSAVEELREMLVPPPTVERIARNRACTMAFPSQPRMTMQDLAVMAREKSSSYSIDIPRASSPFDIVD
jgi:hypothetical protein